MRKIFAIAILLAVVGQAGAQDDTSEVKTGWNFGLLPAVSFDSDLGYQYGGLINLYQYGDGSRYPKYDHSLYFEVSRYTKGSGIYRFYYDSDRLLDNVRITADVSYLPDQAYDFLASTDMSQCTEKSGLTRALRNTEHACSTRCSRSSSASRPTFRAH